MTGAGLRLAFVILLFVVVAAVAWLVARAPTPDQPMSMSVLVDRGTETMQGVDRVGLALTRLSIEEETEIGRAIAARIAPQLPPASHIASADRRRFERQSGYLEAVASTLAERGALRRPGLRYEIRLVPSKVANAFALPGGFVYLTTGLLDLLESEAEVVAILGHEIAHVDLEHCVERIQYEVAASKIGGAPLEAMVSIGSYLWRVGYSDEQEAEADRQGAIYAARAGYDPEAAIRALRRIEAFYGSPPPVRDRIDTETLGMIEDALDDYFATHPETRERVANLERAFREQRFDSSVTPYYIGRRNLSELVPRAQREFPEELSAGSLRQTGEIGYHFASCAPGARRTAARARASAPSS